MFDHRKEAEMRLHSEKLARELALAKQREEGSESNIVTHAPPRSDEGHAPQD
jgi:hypothetical protein